jgi:hypothetical protein
MKFIAGKNVWLPRLAAVTFCLATSIALPPCLNLANAQDLAEISNSQATEFSQTDIEFFENKVRPLLVANCLKCHGDNEEKLRGGLHLTSRAELIKGGDSGPAIVPGKPDESLLIASVRYEDFEMPPKGKLKDGEIEILVQWIKKGAPDPRKTRQVVPSHTIDIEQGKQFWAFVPRKNIQPPAPKNSTWPDSPIDQLILQRLETEGITPVQDANRETLIRRAYIALAGLPPTLAQIDAFVGDPDDIEIAFTKVVEKLLQSSEFGERWGRHWLDVVRFAESSGGGRSLMFPEAWRFDSRFGYIFSAPDRHRLRRWRFGGSNRRRRPRR